MKEGPVRRLTVRVTNDPYLTVIVAASAAFFVLRSWLATQSGFGFHQGWNEGYYALIAHAYGDHPLSPEFFGTYMYPTTPLFSYLVAFSFAILGESVFAARLPSLVAATLIIPATYTLGLMIYRNRRIATVGALLLTVLPYFQLYAGRAQTDVTMLLFFTVALGAIVHGYEHHDERYLGVGGLLFGAGFATKQPMLVLPGVVLFWLLSNRRFDRRTIRETGVLIASSILALLPLAAWFYYNYSRHPNAFVSSWQHELFHRTAAFANVDLILAIGLGLGMTPLVLGFAGIESGMKMRKLFSRSMSNARDANGPTVLGWWLMLYGAFALYRSPSGHQYYAVALAPPIALLAARGLFRIVARFDLRRRRFAGIDLASILLATLVVSSLGGTIVLFDLAGEYSLANDGGQHVARDAGRYLTETVPENATILVSNGYSPPIKWYVRSEFRPEDVHTYFVRDLDRERLERIQRRADGPVYLLYPRPAWGPELPVRGAPVYVTDSYRFTSTALLPSGALPGGKFSHYTGRQRIEVYRLCPDTENGSCSSIR